jgi:hypothetical protein
LEVVHPQGAELLAAQPVVEEGGQDGPVAFAFEGVGRGHLQQRPGLAIAQRRRFALVVICLRGGWTPANAVNSRTSRR